jgi:hypothetical protein
MGKMHSSVHFWQQITLNQNCVLILEEGHMLVFCFLFPTQREFSLDFNFECEA